MSGERNGTTGGLVPALFPGTVVPSPPPRTEIVEVVDALEVEAWAIEHEVAHEGHECDDLMLRYRDEIKQAAYCPRCQLLVSARDGETTAPSAAVAEPTHLETALFVLRANAGICALLAVVVGLTALGFTTPGLAFLIAAGALAFYARGARDP
jgi:hypothetical protein